MGNEDDETLRQLCDSVRALLGRGDGKASPSTVWTGMVEMGLPGMLLPESLGGGGLDILHAASVAEVLGGHGVETPFVTGALVPSAALAGLPDNPAVHRLAAGIAEGRLTAPLAWQEQAGQIEAHAPATEVAAGRLTGFKLFVPDFESGFIVTARHDRLGSALVFVDGADAGVRETSAQLADGSASATLRLENVAAGDDRVLATGTAAERAADRALAAGAVLRAAQLCGLASRTLEVTLAFLQQRRQFGRKLSEFQVLQHRAVDLYGQTRLARASWRSAARKFAGEPTSAMLATVSAAKARCSDVATLVAKQAIQMHGAFGFTQDAGLGQTLNAALSWSASFGNSEAHRIRFHRISRQDAAA